METPGKGNVYHNLHMHRLKDSLAKECRVMAEYAMSNGKPLDARQVEALSKDDDELTSAELLPVYNYLLLLVKPAKPGTLILFEKNRQSDNVFKFLGPLPIIRRFMLVAVVSLLALIAFSLSPDVNATSIELSMLQGSGIDQALRLGFLLAAASVGASFYALFRMNHFINQGTFDVKYSSTYWARYVVGIVAGILLSELFIVFINPDTVVQVDDHISADAGLSEKGILNTTRYLLKPILAILGGFSANLVYRILNRLVEAIESLFKGSSEQKIQQKQNEIMNESQEAMTQVRATTAHHLLGIKNELIGSGVAPELLNKLDDLTGSLVPTLATYSSGDNATPAAPTSPVAKPVAQAPVAEAKPEAQPTTPEPTPDPPAPEVAAPEPPKAEAPKNNPTNPPDGGKPASW